jgi:hypothetical protein
VFQAEGFLCVPESESGLVKKHQRARSGQQKNQSLQSGNTGAGGTPTDESFNQLQVSIHIDIAPDDNRKVEKLSPAKMPALTKVRTMP